MAVLESPSPPMAPLSPHSKQPLFRYILQIPEAFFHGRLMRPATTTTTIHRTRWFDSMIQQLLNNRATVPSTAQLLNY